MTEYKKVIAKNGRVMFYADGKMVSKEYIPVTVKEELKTATVVESETPLSQDHFETPRQVDQKTCIICGDPAEHQKFLSGDIIGLCREHYLNTSSGKIAQAVREKYQDE